MQTNRNSMAWHLIAPPALATPSKEAKVDMSLHGDGRVAPYSQKMKMIVRTILKMKMRPTSTSGSAVVIWEHQRGA